MMVEKSCSDTSILASRQRPLSQTIYHVVFLHAKLRKRLEDRYILDIARILRNNGHKITIYTSEFDPSSCLEEVDPSHSDIQVVYSGWWVPRAFMCFKAVIMALRIIFFPPKPHPKFIFIDTDSIVLFLLAKLSNYKTVYLHHFPGLRQVDIFSCYMKVTTELLTAKTLGYADEIIVQSRSLGEVFRRSFPKIKKELRYFSPLVDVGLWLQDRIDINRIIPDLPKKSYVFVVFGSYCKRSNIRLALDAFENLLQLLDHETRDRTHMVVAAFCSDRSVDEKIYYNELTETTKEKYFASQVTFLRQLPTIHKRTLIEESVAVVHPTKHDPFPETVLAAMHLGRPVIATNTGFAKEVLTHRISGILVEADADKFAASMFKIIANPTIQMFVSDMAHDIFRTQYSFETTCRRMNDLLTTTTQSTESFKKLY